MKEISREYCQASLQVRGSKGWENCETSLQVEGSKGWENCESSSKD